VARRFLGADEAEIGEALAALRQVRDFNDLERFVESHPVARVPGFHSALRGIYFSSRGDAESPATQSFTALYDGLIYLLHLRSYAELCEQPRTDPCPALEAHVDLAPPRLHEVISVAISDHLASR
jgi:hypothetical protein